MTTLPAGDYRLCPRCATRKPPADFARNRANEDGRQHWCRACHEEYDARRREGATSKVPDGTPFRPNARIQLHVRAEVKHRLRALAARQDKTMSRVAGEALLHWLDTHEEN